MRYLQPFQILLNNEGFVVNVKSIKKQEYVSVLPLFYGFLAQTWYLQRVHIGQLVSELKYCSICLLSQEELH